MINQRELIVLLTSAVVLGYIIDFPDFGWVAWLSASIVALMILCFNAFGRKVAGEFYDADPIIDHWNLFQYGIRSSNYFNKPIPMWILAPLIFAFATIGYVKWFAIVTFEATALPSRAKRRFTEMNDWDLAMIAVGGLLFNVLLAFFGRIVGSDEFAKLNLIYILFNLIPIGTLDGAKILFGSRMLWIFSVVFALALLLLLEVTGILATLAIALIIAVGAVATFYYLVEG